jgi:AraC-like DNA-binding protein
MDRRVRRTLERLEVESCGSVPVRELAAHVGISASRLEHLFKRDVGMSIRQFLMRRRLARAAELLRSTYARISDLHRIAGFTDHSNFDHAFKRQFGVSPREFRNREDGAATSA